MRYYREITLKNGKTCILRNGTAEDGQAVLDVFILTHRETDHLLSYPEEITVTPEDEAHFLQEKTDSDNEIEIVAEIDGSIVGSAGIDRLSPRAKLRHRCNLGIAIARQFWGLGLGRALLEACVDCARLAGYAQVELDVVADNDRALALYRSAGFAEYGRNPRHFRTRGGGFREAVYMRREV